MQSSFSSINLYLSVCQRSIYSFLKVFYDKVFFKCIIIVSKMSFSKHVGQVRRSVNNKNAKSFKYLSIKIVAL